MLHTERLSLRPHTLDDFADSVALWGDPEVTRFIGGRPFTAEEVWGRLLRYAGHWTLLGSGFWVVRERASGAFVGEVGLQDAHRDIVPPLGAPELGAPELGWVLSPAQQGKGYATEAVRAAQAWAGARLGAERLVCIIAPDNAASLRVADRCGFRETGRPVYHGETVVRLEHP
ncbi:GNAT family N-acetyltransferase [Deinococcus altitudinis]|uniref:GNAT family N-acetyltransferase n=1 Tax=Deinococcus altitudinis TaxID=468914 RepID=UPI0038917AC4